MAYITQTNIEDVAGVANVATWSNLDNSTATADTVRITRAIAWAEARACTRLRGAFVVPLVAASGTLSTDAVDVIDVIAKLAANWLYSNRRVQQNDVVTDVPGGWRREAEELMDAWIAGREEVNLKRKASRGTSAPVAVF